MAEKLRLFVAVDVGEPVRQQVARIQNSLRPALAGAKWVAPELCHITLKFLGYVDGDRVPGIRTACSRAADGSHAFELELRGLGAFPRTRGARVLWMGLHTGEAPLRELQAAVERELSPLGFSAEERPFSPHLTLARFKQPARLEESLKPFEHLRFGSVRVNELRMMKSTLHPSGPEYRVLESWPLM